jgi:hypothetical protein
MSSNTQKLRVLRSRTDHDLLVLVNREIDRGFALLDVMTTRNSPLFAQAEKALTTAATLLPRISGVNDSDRLRIESKLQELRSRMVQVPAYANVPGYPVPFAS